MRKWQSLAIGTQERGNAAVVTCPGKRRGGGSYSQWAGTQERGEVPAIIRSGWAQGERSGREERGMAVDGEDRRGGMAVDGGERRGVMKKNNYQLVRSHCVLKRAIDTPPSREGGVSMV